MTFEEDFPHLMNSPRSKVQTDGVLIFSQYDIQSSCLDKQKVEIFIKKYLSDIMRGMIGRYYDGID